MSGGVGTSGGGYVQGVGTHPTLDIGRGRGVLTPRTDM